MSQNQTHLAPEPAPDDRTASEAHGGNGQSVRHHHDVSPVDRGSRRRSPRGLILLVVALVLGLLGGTYFHQSLGHLLGLHQHESAGGADGKAKQLWTCGMHPQVIQDKPGLCPICNMALEPLKADVSGGKTASTERKVKYWWDPMMNPPYISSQPGRSPMGMDLVPVYEDEIMAGTAVQIDPVVVQNMGIRVAPVERGPVHRSARVVGFLQESQPNTREVSLRVSGWIEKLHADTEGMLLTKGDPLFELYSPEIKVAIEEVISGRRSIESMGAGADEMARQSGQTVLNASREKLLLWGLDAEEIERLSKLEKAPRTVVFRSPITGHLVEKMIVQGTMVKMGERALRIVDLSTLWLDTQVFAQDLPLVKIGQKVTATVESQAGKPLEGQIVFIHPRIDPMTRTATVRVALPNADLALRPGMYATAHITTELFRDALLVPREAVLDTGDRQVAFVVTGGGQFEPRKVKLGQSSSDGNVQVLEGLAPGEMVVTSGQFLLDSESRMREAIQKHLAAKLLKRPEVNPVIPETAVVSGDHSAHGAQAAIKPTAALPSSPQWREAVDKVVAEYLVLAKRLGEVEKNKDPLDAAALLQAVKGLESLATDEPQKTAARDLAKAAQPMAQQSLDGQRKAFKAVSDAVIALVDHYRPSKVVGKTLYVLHCSMAPGSWLQDTDEKANPYYAKNMKKCADLKRTVATVEH